MVMVFILLFSTFVFIVEILLSVLFYYNRQADVPPDATIVYELSLLSVKEAPEISSLSVQERVNMG